MAPCFIVCKKKTRIVLVRELKIIGYIKRKVSSSARRVFQRLMIEVCNYLQAFLVGSTLRKPTFLALDLCRYFYGDACLRCYATGFYVKRADDGSVTLKDIQLYFIKLIAIDNSSMEHFPLRFFFFFFSPFPRPPLPFQITTHYVIIYVYFVEFSYRSS